MKIKNFILDLFFPRFCLNCQKEGEYLCIDCQSLLEILESSFCLCQKPIRLDQPGKCPNCLSKKLNGLYFALSYQNNLVQKLIHNFKYDPYLKKLAKTLASFIITHFQLLNNNDPSFKEKFSDFVLIPIPLTKKKLKKRGFNQAQELAKELSRFFQIPLISDCLIKIKETPPQVELSEKERRKNLRGAFKIENKEKIEKKKIFLIDDIYTTGSTMEEAAQVLKEAGAQEIWGIVVARG